MEIFDIVKRYFGYDNFRAEQEKIIRSVMDGHDCLVLMPTGGGKSLCYQIPAIAMNGTAIVISPLISWMKDQVDTLIANGIEAAALTRSNSPEQDLLVRRKAANGTLKLLYISPERLMAEVPYFLKQIQISLFAIDEAHCISQWGHDFRPEYTPLGFLHDEFLGVPLMALTATADKVTRNDIVRQLKLRNHLEFVSSFDRPNLSLSVKRGYTSKEKMNYIVNYLMAHPADAGIIYCLSKKSTEKVASQLQAKGIRAAAYHAGLSMEERDHSQLLFNQDQIQVICATVAFGMGIDKSNVRWVIHYSLPKSIESFYQEIGRAGRDGAPADTILFYSLADIVQLSVFAKESGERDMNLNKLRSMQKYAESGVCRRRILLNYFGEMTDHDCGNCDVCKNPPKRFDGTRYIQMALSAIRRADEKIRISTTIEILKGINSPTVQRFHYNTLKTFGVGSDISTTDWNDYLLQMFQMGFIEILYDQNNIVRITPIGEDILYGRREAQLCVIDRDIATVAKPRRLHLQIPAITIPGMAVSSGVEDPRLFEALRVLRKECADKEGFPPYIVFSDKVLHAIATNKPTTIEQFGFISGIGDFKKQKYGEKFLKVIRRFV